MATKYFSSLFAVLQRIQEPLKRCLSRKYQNFLSSDWLPVEDAQYFSLQEFYVPIMLEEKIQIPGGAKVGKTVFSLTDTIKELMQDGTRNCSILIEGELFINFENHTL